MPWTLDRIRTAIARLGGVWHSTALGARATCPAHDDRTPSLSVTVQPNGTVLWHCHAGCSQEAVAQALARALPDMPAGAEAVYRYVDRAGVLRYEVVRFRGKQFRRRRPDGAGGWVWSTAGVEPILYRWPELAGPVAWIPEGEKDADRLAALGLVATTSGGAGSWRPAFVVALREAGVKAVVVLADHDEPGRRHADTVARTCLAGGLRVKRLDFPELPPHGDVSDWLDAGGTVEALRARAAAAPWWAPDPDTTDTWRLEPASAVPAATPAWTWEGWLPAGALSLLAGAPGVGKSLLTAWIAARLTRGELPGVHAGQPARVVLVAIEDSWRHTVIPRLIAQQAQLDAVLAPVSPHGDRDLRFPRDVETLGRLLDATPPALLILDPILSRLDPGLDTNHAQHVRTALEPLLPIAERIGCAILGVTHVTKHPPADPLAAVLGSSAFGALARSVWLLERPAPGSWTVLRHVKSNIGPIQPARRGRILDGRWSWEHDSPIRRRDTPNTSLFDADPPSDPTPTPDPDDLGF